MVYKNNPAKIPSKDLNAHIQINNGARITTEVLNKTPQTIKYICSFCGGEKKQDANKIKWICENCKSIKKPLDFKK